MSKPANPERFTLVLESLPDATSAIARLRRVLKALLRSYRLKAVAVVANPPSSRTIPMTTPATDVSLSAALDDLARGLDRVASELCDLTADERERALARLQRLAADVGALADELGRDTPRAEPSLGH